jgi:hypothetical protein
MVTDIAMVGIRNVKDYHLGSVNKNSVELHKDTAMQDREYENEEALRSLATNHQRTFSDTPSCDEFMGVARSYINALDPLCMADSRTTPAFYNSRPGDDDGQWYRSGQVCCLDDTITVVMAIVTEHYDRLIDGDVTSHCAYKGNDKR